MKKLFVALGLGALLMGTTAMAIPASPPPAPPPVDEKTNNGAIVINEDGVGSCYFKMIVPGYSEPDGPLYWLGTDVHFVQNKNNIKVVCKLDIIDYVPEKPIKANDFACRVVKMNGMGHFVESTDSKFIWTPGGEARLECFYRNVDEIVLGFPL